MAAQHAPNKRDVMCNVYVRETDLTCSQLQSTEIFSLTDHGLSAYYTNDYYVYETVPTSCSVDSDCGSEDLLWCENVVTMRCMSKVKQGGVCTGE